MKVVYSPFGLANRYDDFIEININLRKDKLLRDYAVKHELGHQSKFDLKHEFDVRVPFFKLTWFIVKHPSTWLDFLPLQFRKGVFVYDLNLILLYGLLVVGIIGTKLIWF